MREVAEESSLKLYTSPLIARLAQRRARKDVKMPLHEDLLALFGGHNQFPKYPPAIVDRALLTVLGLSEIQSDILLAIWEGGGELPIWGDGTSPDLCHELDMTSSSIRNHIKPLVALGLVSITAKNRAQWTKAISPEKFGRKVSEAMLTSAARIINFFVEKQKEFSESKVDEHRFFSPTSAYGPKKLLDELSSLCQSPKTVYGVITATVSEDSLSLQSLHQIRCRSGPKIHLLPDWPQFHATKRAIIERGESPLIEFHTHPKGLKKPSAQDIQKMKMLRRGYWLISSSDGLALWSFYHETSHGRGGTKLRLHVNDVNITPT